MIFQHVGQVYTIRELKVVIFIELLLVFSPEAKQPALKPANFPPIVVDCHLINRRHHQQKSKKKPTPLRVGFD